MATIVPTPYDVPLPPTTQAGMEITPIQAHETSARTNSLSSPGRPQAFPNPAYSPVSNIQSYDESSTDWQGYDTNGNVKATFQTTSLMPSPPSTLTSISSTTSLISSPAEHSNHLTNPTRTTSSCITRPRSNSIAIPLPTTTCPNCGLRRPSSASDLVLSPSTRIQTTNHLFSQQPHLPLHLHCPDSCPDTILPSQAARSPFQGLGLSLPYQKQRHHRRRSSLCYSESLIEDASVIDGGGVTAEMRQGWENQAESIARKVLRRQAGLEGTNVVEEAIVED